MRFMSLPFGLGVGFLLGVATTTTSNPSPTFQDVSSCGALQVDQVRCCRGDVIFYEGEIRSQDGAHISVEIPSREQMQSVVRLRLK